MSAKTIAVVGVTGNQGGSVATHFSTLPDYHVRGITRDPSKPTSTTLKQRLPNIDLVAADLDDVPSLAKAFSSATVIFGVTDFWQFIKDPANHAAAAARNITVNEIAYEREVQHGKNIVDAAAATPSLERLILSTVNSSKKNSGGKITFNLHFDAKWAAVEYCQETYPELWAKTSLLQMGFFATNWKDGVGIPKKDDASGKYIQRLAMRPTSKTPMVDPTADTGRFVHALVQCPPGVNMIGAGSLIDWNEYLAIWGRVNGVETGFEQIPYETLEKEMGSVGREIADMFRYIDEFGYDGGDGSVVYPWEVRGRFGVEVEFTGMEEYISRQDWNSVM